MHNYVIAMYPEKRHVCMPNVFYDLTIDLSSL